jgi:hypothetical protein
MKSQLMKRQVMKISAVLSSLLGRPTDSVSQRGRFLRRRASMFSPSTRAEKAMAA